jgi:hypothetical protein
MVTATAKESVPKIYHAIAAIQAGVGNIPKAGVGPATQGAYKYVKNDDILEAISKLMIEHKVITRPVITNHYLVTRELPPVRDNTPPRAVPMTVLTLDLTYISTEDGSEFTVSVTAEGADNGDKGGRKAATQAQKIANLLTFNIATGEPDPDGMEVTPNASRPSAAATKIDKAAAATTSGTANEIKAFLGAAKLNGAVANTLADRLSGGKPSSEWKNDENVLKQVLAALKAGEVA